MVVAKRQIKKEEIKSLALHPLNIRYASEESVHGTTELDSILYKYSDLINSISRPLTIDAVKDYETLMFNKTPHLCNFDRVIFNSSENLEPMLHSNSMEFYPVETRKWEVEKELSDHMVLAGGMHCKMYTLTNMHAELPPGWIYEPFSNSDFLRIFIKPVPKERHLKTINSHKSLQATRSSAEDMDQTDDVAAIRELVLNAKTDNLFSVIINAGILGIDAESMQEKIKEFEASDNKNRTEMYSMKNVQSKFLRGQMGQKHLMVRSSMPALIPFVTSEIYEDGGCLLGRNMITGNPVKWDINQRINRNTVLAATSGSGKTTLAMMIIHAFEKMYPDTFIFVIDPESEYRALSDNMGFHYLDYSSGTKLGFDVFKMVADPISAVETLCDVLQVPSLDRTLPFQAAARMSIRKEDRDFFKFYDELVKLEEGSHGATPSQYFSILAEPPFNTLLQGRPPTDNKIVLSLKNIGSAGGAVQRIITQIALAYAMGKSLMMPKIVPKLFMLDEVWMLLQHESLGNYIQNLSRRGRKYNINMMMASQNIEDMTENPAARNVLVNSDTVMFLRQSETTLKSLVTHFVLSSEAATTLMRLKVGQAMIKFGNSMVPANVMPDEEQLKLFKPK